MLTIDTTLRYIVLNTQIRQSLILSGSFPIPSQHLHPIETPQFSFLLTALKPLHFSPREFPKLAFQLRELHDSARAGLVHAAAFAGLAAAARLDDLDGLGSGRRSHDEMDKCDLVRKIGGAERCSEWLSPR